MSSYWAGYSGTGLVLTQPEFNDMLKVYKEKNPTQSDIDEYFEDRGVDEVAFIKSVYIGEVMPDLQDNEESYAGKITYFCELSDDNVDGVTFWPFYNPDGQMNTNKRNKDGTWEEAKYSYPIWASKQDRCYVLWSRKSLSGPEAFEEKPYPSYDAFVQEFKDAMEAYLPDDFDWNAHLGFISYACYA